MTYPDYFARAIAFGVGAGVAPAPLMSLIFSILSLTNFWLWINNEEPS